MVCAIFTCAIPAILDCHYKAIGHVHRIQPFKLTNKKEKYVIRHRLTHTDIRHLRHYQNNPKLSFWYRKIIVDSWRIIFPCYRFNRLVFCRPWRQENLS